MCHMQMAKLPAEVRDRGVITSSAGNHAQGVALAASRMVRELSFSLGFTCCLPYLAIKAHTNIMCKSIHAAQGCKATICMPVNTPGIKVESVRKLGGTVELVGESYQETQVCVCAVRGNEDRERRDQS